LLELVEANRAYNSSLRVYVVRNDGSAFGSACERRTDLIGMTTDLKDWGNGVKLALEPQARHAASKFAGTKILSWAINLTLVEEAQAKGADAIVAMRFDTSEMGGNWTEICAYGTAVRARKG